MSGALNDAVAIYFADATLASAFVARRQGRDGWGRVPSARRRAGTAGWRAHRDVAASPHFGRRSRTLTTWRRWRTSRGYDDGRRPGRRGYARRRDAGGDRRLPQRLQSADLPGHAG